MENPNADTEWNDALRLFNILPPKAKEAEVTEDQIVKLVDDTVREKTVTAASGDKPLEQMTLDELDLVEDEEDERALQAYRMKRMMEMKVAALKARFGEVVEITAKDYVQEVNNAGEKIWVVLHLYQQGVPLCMLINQHLTQLARKFPQTKFLKSIATLCIQNYPDKNLPAIFVYFEGDMKKQLVGPHVFAGMNLKVEGLEWMLAEAGAVTTDLEAPTKNAIRDVLFSSLGTTHKEDVSDDGSADENDL